MSGIHLTIDQLNVYKCEVCGEILVETQEIARDVARKILEARTERKHTFELPTVKESFDYPLVVSS